MATITVEDRNGERKTLTIPANSKQNLMESLKEAGYRILATCGGIALCATCLIEVLQGAEQLPGPTGAELDMLDILPHTASGDRLSCQLWNNQIPDGLTIRLKGDEHS
ncbi:(2Fe-2S)-binding protein [Pedobacter sp. BS3]|uniref:2Fe-2S iron-sulfur cluster-binding protein n=1 Tax=Pedobacter sp. BS3 TaxID=2567937 RepID=UPI0011EC9B72|nr:2Fe-2S iron-sulfur cluster-binding protein [Pedobacter sp. BS3]TZF82799.1 (2Fe-2S)-binding protein [Pedobacter sp. BS3]